MSLLDKALAAEVRTVEPRIALAVRDATPKLRAEVLDLLEAAIARRVNYTTAGRVLTEALGIRITDESIRKHAAAVLAEHGR